PVPTPHLVARSCRRPYCIVNAVGSLCTYISCLRPIIFLLCRYKMRFACFLALLVPTFTASDKGIASAVEAAPGDVVRVPDMKRIDPDSKIRRLRKRKKPESEERMIVPPYAAMMNVMHSTSTTSTTSTQSSQILHSMKDHTPLPKWAKALVAVLSVAAAAGIVVGGVKLTQWLNQSLQGE
ncbi:hypothetical protein F441_06850, partial [Phytophthora nicotianae CJ01A1]